MSRRIALGEITPWIDFQQDYQRGARSIPITTQLPADLDTPLSLFLKLKSENKLGFLLESVERGESTGRYSFLGFGTAEDLLVPPESVDPISWLQSQLPLEAHEGPSDLPKFWGGAVGHLGWEAARHLEPTVGPRPERFGAIDGAQHAFLRCQKCLIFDHVAQVITAVVVVIVPAEATEERLKAEYHSGVRTLEELKAGTQRESRFTHCPRPDDFVPEEEFLTPKETFIDQVRCTKSYIRSGDIFQLVLSQRVRRKTWLNSVAIYRTLRMLNPSPYTFLLDFGAYQLVGSSPEMLVSLDGDRATVCPIAGTRKRTGDHEVDTAAKLDLLGDDKERAEHLMLVDLGRNDLGRVCRFGSVQVPRYCEVELYSHVMHIVSRVEGELQPGLTAFDLLRAAFPAGTVSGAPKIRAMQLIDELETGPRDFYAGAVGYFGTWGSLDTCIAIRTLMLKDGWVNFQAGAGIVADSDPESEWEETLNKLAALREAVDLAESLFGGTQ